ncbi:MAG: tRNA sulfurtransferase [Haloferacaceae archaeon]
MTDTPRGAAPEVVLAAYGEIGVKSSRVRGRMERRLRDNLAAVLDDRGIDAAVERRWSRLVVETPDPDAAAAAAADVPGVVWARPAAVVPPTLDAVARTTAALAERVEPTTFAVRANRAGPPERHPFSAREVERRAGAAVEAATDATVDLDDPGTTIRVDVRERDAFVSPREVRGPGGLPVGTQGRAVALVSGGIDSPVAAWETMRRGCAVVPTYVDLGDYGGADHRARAIRTIRRLARYAPNEDLRPRVVEAGDIAADLVESVDDTRMLSLRRAMLAAGAALAERTGADAVVTGESIGQKSSQTGPNLAVTDAAVDLPVHRPLLTRDKEEVVAAARDLGTFEDATVAAGCQRVAPTAPETRASLDAVAAAEPGDLLDRARAAGRDARVIEVGASADADADPGAGPGAGAGAGGRGA